MNIPRYDGHKEEKSYIEKSFSGKRKIYVIIQKIVIAVVALCLLLGLETTLLSSLPVPFLGKAGQGAPALGFLFVLSVAYLLGEKDGCVAGCMAGFFYECLTGSGYLFLCLFYALVGYVVGLMAKKILAHNAPSFLVYVVVFGLIECLRCYVAACLQTTELVPYPYLLYGLLPRFWWTVVFALLVYAPVRVLQRSLDRK